MCNLYTQTRSVDEIASLFRNLDLPLTFPDGIPNLQPKDIGITDPAPIVRQSATPDALDLVVRRWSWPGPGGKPVYNFRSEGRDFPNKRCLIIADGFYEFTSPENPKQKRKTRWLFTCPNRAMMGIAGLTRLVPGVGEAFTMLTTEPGPDVAPYHNRQIVVLPNDDWAAWLGYSGPAAPLLRPTVAGSLEVRSAPR